MTFSWILLSSFLATTTLRSVGSQTYDSDVPPSTSSGTRIVNGQDVVSPGRFPYFVAIFDKNDNLRCGGSLIAPNIVLSAAHCQ